MKLKKNLLRSSYLYVIADKNICWEKSLSEITCQAIKGNADIIQLRDKASPKGEVLKMSRILRKLLLKKNKLFIINDYVDIAKILDADGVHLGQNDIPIEIAREILGKDKIIGISCHSLKEAVEAEAAQADYIGIGPVFKTSTKPQIKPIGLGILMAVRNRIKIPAFAIGGINLHNINQVLSAGARRVSICSAICAKKNVFAAAKNFSEILHN